MGHGIVNIGGAPKHASRHASGAADAVTPSAIGAAELLNTVVTPSQARVLMQIKTASFTLAANDAEKLTLLESTSPIVVTIPLDSTYNFPIGTSFSFIRWSTGATSFTFASGIFSVAVNGVTAISAYGCAATLVKLSENAWWLICG